MEVVLGVTYVLTRSCVKRRGDDWGYIAASLRSYWIVMTGIDSGATAGV